VDRNWRVFIVAHDRVHEEMYAGDPLWNPTNYSFLNVGNGTLIGSGTFQVVQQRDLPNARSLGKHWAESEGIYNIYRSGRYQDYDFVGFLQYDKELRLKKRRLGLFPGATNITERVNRSLSREVACHISFETHETQWDFNQRILADERYPETLVGSGRNCYDYILTDYNRFFGTSYSMDDVLRHRYINLCSCFLVDVATFEKMMSFFSTVVESGRLDVFDKQRRHRLQGGLAERYFGMFLLFEYSTFVNLNLHHRNLKGSA